MSQQLMQSEKNAWGKGQVLAAVLAGDVAAATISATAISPILTVIDRSVVENAAPANQLLLSTLRTNILNSVRRPRLLFATKPFLYMWTLYAATYTTANAVESIGTALTAGADRILISSITFISTCLVNVPLGVWKDMRFVQTYGRSVEQVKFSKMVGNTRPVASPTRSTSPARATRSSRTVAATFLFRDAITIFGSISLPPMLSSAVSAPDPLIPDPSTKNAAIQIFTPVLSQVVATPLHLLGLDFYTSPESSSVERTQRIKSALLPTTAIRCARIIPAFGIGMVMNTWLRDCFHGQVRGNDSP
ncbi:hypothetical protein AG0111_0g8416 [Alternaria gaisen]|uniref:Uncharacterized protein n=1 Tax=Alternaria gaisen TaxID=167740 RepID=A0ACB6FGF7_9PLEO|nr:hypothetical protein AG0111_0g8416 [Alternaria gaisen]